MGTPLIRAMNTIDLLHQELSRERESRKTAELCIEKILTAVDKYKGKRLTTSIRHYIAHHQTVYRHKAKDCPINTNNLTKKQLQSIIVAKHAEIEALCKRIDSSDATTARIVGPAKIK
jgi:hypothetical protein